MSNKLSIDISDSMDDFHLLKKDWETLLSSSGCLPVCINWDWINLWWETYANDNNCPIILRIFDKNELVGILPLYNVVTRRNGKQYCFLYYMATSNDYEGSDMVSTEYIDILVKKDYAEDVCHRIAYFFKNEYTLWNEIVFNRFLEDSYIKKYLIPNLHEKSFKSFITLEGFRRYLNLPKNFKAYSYERSQSFLEKSKNYNDELNTLGKVRYEIIQTHEALDHAIDVLISMHLKRFEVMKEGNRYTNKDFTNFHRQLSHKLLEAKQLDFNVLKLDNKIIAIEYNIKIDQAIYCYTATSDISLSNIDLGLVLKNNVIEKSIQDKYKVYDFMMGEEKSSANAYGSQLTKIFDCYIFNHASLRSTFSYSKIRAKRILVDKVLSDSLRNKLYALRARIKNQS